MRPITETTDSPQKSFSVLYVEMKDLIRAISNRYHKMSGVPYEEFVSQLSEELWVAYRLYETSRGAKLETWLNIRLRDRAKVIVRDREGSYYRKVTFLKQNSTPGDDEDALTSEIATDYTLEEYIEENKWKKKEADQLELIDSLVNDPAQVDPVTTLIVTKFSQYDSITALAKALGIHHETVKRKLRALSRRYDANRFGDYHEYLAV